MTRLKISACRKAAESADHWECLFGTARDIEIQGFMFQPAMAMSPTSEKISS